MKTLSVGTKLIGGFVILLVLAGAVGWAGLRLAGRGNRDMQSIFTDEVSGLVKLSTTVGAANEVRRRGLLLVLVRDPQEKSRLASEGDRFAAEVDRQLDELERLWAGEPQKLEPLARLRDLWTDYLRERGKALDLLAAGDLEGARAALAGPVGERFLAVDESLGELVRANEEAASGKLETALGNFATGRNAVLGTVGLAIALGLTIGIVLSRSIAANLARVARAAEGLAGGDLTRRAQVTSGDEVGALAEAFNAMASRLQETVESERRASELLQDAVRDYSDFAARVAGGDLTARLSGNGSRELNRLTEDLNRMVEGLGGLSTQVRAGAQSIAAAANEILAAASQYSAGATEQSAAINQTTTTVEEIHAAAAQVAEKARDVARGAQTSARASDEGTRAVSAVVEAMQDVRSRVEAMAQDILELSERTQQIGEIIASVDDLADQSNLLALNAAIEAAKAGEQGKGFAVVADEVRNLAEQSKQAAAQVRTILREIQKATDAAVMATEQGTAVVEGSLHLGERAGEMIEQLAETIRQGSHAAQQITAAAHQQNVGMDQIAQAMGEISRAMSQFVDGAHQSKNAAEGLNDLAGRLQELTGAYRI